jgi:hypothetical protein
MSSVNFAIPDFCLLIPNVPSVGRQFSGRTTLEEAVKPYGLAGALKRGTIPGLPGLRRVPDVQNFNGIVLHAVGDDMR